MSEVEVTKILRSLGQGDKNLADDLLPLVYGELRNLAAAKLRQENPGHTLQATALVHEAYLRLVETDEQQVWGSRRHFFAAAAEAMRRILIDNARRKNAAKRGGNMLRTIVDLEQLCEPQTPEDLLDLDAALTLLEQHDSQAALMVKLRYFSGLTVKECSEILDLSRRSTERLWTYAKVWLYDRLR